MPRWLYPAEDGRTSRWVLPSVLSWEREDMKEYAPEIQTLQDCADGSGAATKGLSKYVVCEFSYNYEGLRARGSWDNRVHHLSSPSMVGGGKSAQQFSDTKFPS